jgi:hypothetical protein
MGSRFGLNYYAVEILDELDHKYAADDLTSVTVLTADTRKTAATIYDDPNGQTSKTNPIATFTDGGHVQFWVNATTVDLIVKLSNGACKRINGVTTSRAHVTVDRSYLTLDGVPVINSSLTGTTMYAFPLGSDKWQVEFHLASEPITLGLTATNGISYGGVKLADCDTGVSGIEGRLGDLSLSIADAMTQYFTDATPEGTLGVGNKVKDDAADVGGSDSQDDNILGTVDFTMAAYADTEVLLNEAENIVGNNQDIVLNISVDAADINDDMTDAQVLVSGVLETEVTWKAAS